MSEEVRVGIIGCGRIAGHHCRSIGPAAGVTLTAVCDLVEEKAKAYSDEYDVPYYQNYHEMLGRHPEITTVAVITPSGMHFEHSMELLQRYEKHLIVEKPTFMRPSQVKEAYGLAESLGKAIFPVFQNRYNKAVQRVHQALQSDELGAIRLVNVRVRWCRPQRYYDLAPWRGTYAMDGGAISNQGIHHVDLLRYLAGEVKMVNASMRTLGAEIEVEDTVVATMQYHNDVVGSLEVTTSARPDDFEASLSLVCEKGLAQLGGIAVNELQIFTPDPAACEQNSEDFSKCVYGFGHGEFYKDVGAYFNNGVSFPVSRGDCLGTIKLLHSFYLSDELGGNVEVAEDAESTRLGAPNEELAALYRCEG